jgi:colicin import membrane protein
LLAPVVWIIWHKLCLHRAGRFAWKEFVNETNCLDCGRSGYFGRRLFLVFWYTGQNTPEPVAMTPDSAAASVGEAAETATDNAEGMVEQAAEAVETVTEGATEAASEAVEATTEAVIEAAEVATEAVTDAVTEAVTGTVEETTSAVTNTVTNTVTDTVTDTVTETVAAAAGSSDGLSDLLTMEGFDLEKVIEAVDGSDLDALQKTTLKTGLQQAKDNPELLKGVLSQVKSALGL